VKGMPPGLLLRMAALLCAGVALAWGPAADVGHRARGASGLGAPRHPFGSHLTRYTPGSIRPGVATQTQLDAAATAFYEAWKRRYLVQGCGEGAYVFVNADGSDTGGNKDPNSITVSEGHGYGMMIAALMAGYDPQAKTYFDRLYRFFRDHPSRDTPYLMAWNQIAGCADATRGDGSVSATDGDMDIAYALVLADRQWGSAGPINYLEEARRVIRAIREREINPATHVPLLGDWASPDEPGYYYGTRPSDFMPDHFRTFQSVTADATWAVVIDSGYRLLLTVQNQYSPLAGLVPDFIRDTNTAPRPAGPRYLETADDGHLSLIHI